MTDYQFYKRMGICPKCKKKTDREGKQCQECLDKENDYSNKTRKFLKEIGICPVCRKEKLFGNERQCISCRQKNYERNLTITKEQKKRYNDAFRKQQRSLYQERSEKGICTRCGKRKAYYGKKKCKICLDKDSELHRLKK